MNTEKNRGDIYFVTLLGRGDVIRTHGLYVPNVALYQTEPHLDSKIKPRNIKNTGADSWLRN